MDWSLLSCGQRGHLTFAPDEPDLRHEMRAVLPDGAAWRCLRCGTFVPGPPSRSGPAATAPAVPRGRELRGKLILRLFAIERFVRAIVFAAVAYGLWQFRAARSSIEAAFNRELPVVRDAFRELGFDIDNSKFVGLIHHALTLSSQTVTLLAVGATVYTLVELVEGTGLWLARRWGEYFAMVATSFGLPLEAYDLTRKVSATALTALVINLALVVYLVLAKRLFGVRGGKGAYEARLRGESVLEEAQRAVALRQPAPQPATSAIPAPAATPVTGASPLAAQQASAADG